MDSNFPTPPTTVSNPRGSRINITPIVLPGVVNNDGHIVPFFQSTRKTVFGKTALNNAIGANFYTYASLGVEIVDGFEVELSEDAILRALGDLGVRFVCVDRDALKLFMDYDVPATWIMKDSNTGGHYVVLRRLDEGGPLWLLDSFNQRAQITTGFFRGLVDYVRSDEQISNLFMFTLYFPDDFLVEINSSK